ncbi:MAG: RNA polymerase B [Chrysothrix sp. TS-e1954]|nr:MAG: RNA polymerase B [Chrysothrix sp. TS-e1954]
MASNGVPRHAPTSRARPVPLGDEEATSQLSLGEFHSAPTMSNSEARLLVDAVLARRRENNGGRAIQETEVLQKTQDYLAVFARFKAAQNVEQVERLLSAGGNLEGFEKSQLGTLCCETADEAKTLIPSLGNKISDADLDNLLQEITNLRQYVD